MTARSRQTTLAASAKEVFDFVTSPENFDAYVAGYGEGRVTSAEPTGFASSFEWNTHLGPWTLHAREQVVDWEAPRRVVYEGELAGVPFRSSMNVRERRDGCELEVGVDYSVPASKGGRATELLLQPMIDRDIRSSLDRLVARFGDPRDVPSHDDLVGLYRRRARHYDQSTQLYRLLGYPLASYRRMAADALALSPGDTVVEIGCGTGANFELLQERVGPTGRVIGVDLTDAMLAEAARKVEAHGWGNVELVRTDAARFEFPRNVNGILSTFALTHCPDYDAVIEHGAAALAPGGRWVVLDLKVPERYAGWMLSLGLAATKPFGVTLGAANRHPWESLERHLPHSRMRDLYLGITYLAQGSKRA